MSLKTHLGGDAATPSLPIVDTQQGSLLFGPYIGIVKSNQDPLRMGRLGVYIPSIAGYAEPSTGKLVTCEYLAPFYGAKTTKYLGQDDPYNYKSSQHSYGMWMVPPDIDAKVLVIFVEGKVDQAFWIGCVQEPLTNHMVPGIAATEKTGLMDTGSETDSKQSMYGTEKLPAGEINRATLDVIGSSPVDPILKHPIHPFAETLRQQGLVQDTVRGTTTSSARRESPSNVFGISTPGRRDNSSSPKVVGVEDSKQQEIIDRLTGHTFVMDDGDNAGDNQLIRLRSASGHQLLLNDTYGVVYIANGSGNVWMEFSANGSIDIYSGGGVNIRSRGDMNLHSDNNINMFARKQIKMSAVGKLVIDGGAIQTYSDTDIQSQARYGSITNKAPNGSIVSYAAETQLHMASGQTHLTGSQIHFNSIGTSPNIIATYERTSVQDPSGTGTLREAIPDVNPANKYTYGPLKVEQNSNISMSGMRVCTHEPFPYHFDKIVTFVGGDYNSVLSNTPGTPEFIAHRNRLSDDPSRRIMQFAADLQYRLQKDGLGQVPTAVNKVAGAANQPTGDIQKIQKAANDIATDYAKLYNLRDNGPFNISPIAEGVSSVIQQTVTSLTGANVNILKDQVFVSQAGLLYSAGNLGQAISTPLKSASGNLSSVKNIASTAGNVLKTYNTVKDKFFTKNAGDREYTDYGVPAGAATAGDAVYTNYGDNTSVSSFISTDGPFGGGNIFGNIFSPTGGIVIPTIPGVGQILGQIPGQIIGQIPGLGQINQAIGTYNIVNDVYKNVMGSDITSVTQISSLVTDFGSAISSQLASIGSAIGSLFGFGGGGSYIDL